MSEEPLPPLSELSNGRLKNLFFQTLRERKDGVFSGYNIPDIKAELHTRGLIDDNGNVNNTPETKKARPIKVQVRGMGWVEVFCPRCKCKDLINKKDGTIRCSACEYTKIKELFVKLFLNELASQDTQQEEATAALTIDMSSDVEIIKV